MSLSIFAPSSRFFDDNWLVTQDPLFGSLLRHNSANTAKTNGNCLVPMMSVDLTESETEFNIHADLPGVAPEDLEVTLEGKSLVIKAERQYVHKTDTDKVHSIERSFGKVQRSFRMPNNVDLDKLASTFRNGVLSISVPKVAPPAPTSRKIAVSMEA